MFVLIASTAQGPVFYTGRAGDGWVNANRGEAFTYSAEGAAHKAALFNRNSRLHGLTFTVGS